jgi:hypothetical protein
MAIALSKIKVQAEHGLMMIYSFVALMLTNVVVVMLANYLFPQAVVLGTYSISYWWALHHSMFKLTVINVFVMPLVSYYEWKKNVTFTPKQWMITYFVVNTIALYGITRFAENLGLGVSSWVVVVLLAGALDIVQGMVMMSLGKAIKM